MSKEKLTNYDKMKYAMAEEFVKYDQEKMIRKFQLEIDRDWLYIDFVGRKYRISRQSGQVEWSNDQFLSVYEADYNEAMTIYDVFCNEKEEHHLAHEFVTLQSLTKIQSGNLSNSSGFFQQTANGFNGKVDRLKEACIKLSGKPLEKGDAAYELPLFSFLPVILRFWEADEEFPASLQILVDKNTLDYMHYETLMFALSHLFHRIKGEM